MVNAGLYLAGAGLFFYLAPVTTAFLLGAIIVVAVSHYGHKDLLELVRDHVRLPAAPGPALAAAARARPLTVDDVQQELRMAGLEKCALVLGIDYTKSNEWTGKRTFGGRSMHDVAAGTLNPYQCVIQSVGETLAVFDDDGQIPVYGFGDTRTQNHSVFPLNQNAQQPTLAGFHAVLECYTAVTPAIALDGPTSFVAIIHEALTHVTPGSFTILVIITDGAVTDEEETQAAIIEASHHALSIIAIGVGDGPWDAMEAFDNDLPERTFDNFTFVEYDRIMRQNDGNMAAFAQQALRETPAQFKEARRLGMMKAAKAATRLRGGRKGY